MTLDTRFALFAVLHESDSSTLETCCDVRHSVAGSAIDVRSCRSSRKWRLKPRVVVERRAFRRWA